MFGWDLDIPEFQGSSRGSTYKIMLYAELPDKLAKAEFARPMTPTRISVKKEKKIG